MTTVDILSVTIFDLLLLQEKKRCRFFSKTHDELMGILGFEVSQKTQPIDNFIIKNNTGKFFVENGNTLTKVIPAQKSSVIFIPDEVKVIGKNLQIEGKCPPNVIANEVELILEDAFKEQSELENVIMKKCSTISDRAFYHCNNLQNAMLDSAAWIADYAFAHCENLGTLVAPNLGDISPNAFIYCNKVNLYDVGGRCRIKFESQINKNQSKENNIENEGGRKVGKEMNDIRASQNTRTNAIANLEYM